MIPSLFIGPRTLLNDCNHSATAIFWRSAIHSLSLKTSALQLLQKSSKSASTTLQRRIWNSFAMECGIFGRTDLELFCNAGFLRKGLYLRRTAVLEVLWTQTWDPFPRHHLLAGVTRGRLMFLLGKPSHTRPSPLEQTRWHSWLHRGGCGCVTAACLDGAYLAAELRRVPAFPAAAPAGRGAGHMPAAAPAGRGAGHSTRKCTAAP